MYGEYKTKYVIPAKAGIQNQQKRHWIPGHARNDGMQSA